MAPHWLISEASVDAVSDLCPHTLSLYTKVLSHAAVSLVHLCSATTAIHNILIHFIATFAIVPLKA